jgi:hypothetical protein
VVLVDGDRHQIELIQAEAARRKAAVHLVIDLVHVLQYLWAAAWCFHARDDPAAEDWGRRGGPAVLAGRARRPPSRSPRRPMRAGWPMTGEPAQRRACAT